MTRPSSVTIREVARVAGVSVATVSRVLNNVDRVTDITRARVRKVVEQLGYDPHGRTRGPVIRHTGMLAVLLPDLHGEYFSELIRGIDDTARKDGFHTLLARSHNDPAELSAALATLRGRVDGFIVVSPGAEARVPLMNLARKVPTVLVGGAERLPFSTLSVDNFGGVQAMLQHLRSLGHRRIVFVRGPAGNAEADERLHAVRVTASSLADVLITAVSGDFRQASGFEAIRRVLADGKRRQQRPHAVFAANDAMAIGALAAVQDAGLRVPEDVAVVGFDNIPMARLVNPALTTVDTPITELGRRATRRMIDALRRGRAPDAAHTVLPATLLVRDSCGAHRAMTGHAPTLLPVSEAGP